jgi:hypothetical protein
MVETERRVQDRGASRFVTDQNSVSQIGTAKTRAQRWQVLEKLIRTAVQKFRDVSRRVHARLEPFLMRIERRSDQWVVILSGLALATVCFVTVSYYPPAEISSSDARALLISLAEILTTILAISVSLLIVGLQFISESYTPRALKTFFEDPLFIGYLAVYATSIFSILASLAVGFVPLQTFRVCAVFVTVFCVVYLLVLLFRIPSLLRPSYVIQRLGMKVPKHFCEDLVKREGRSLLGMEDESLLAIDQTVIRSIVQDELQAFLAGLRYLNSVLRKFLIQTERILNAVEKKKEIRESPSYVFEYFLTFYRRMVWQSLSHARQEHLMYLCQSLEDHMVHLHRLKAFRAFGYVAEVYDYAGLTAVDQRLITFAEYFSRSLNRLTKVQLSLLDEPLFPFEEPLRPWAELSEEQRDLKTVRSIMSDFNLRNRIEFLSHLAETAAARKLDSTVSSCMFIFAEALDKTLSLQPIGKRRVFTTSVMQALVDTHKKCLQSGINSTTFTTHMLHYKIERMKDPADVAEFGHYIATAYARMAILSIEHGFYDELWEWGVNGRYLVRSHPDLAIVVVDVLEKALKIMKPKITRENVWFYMQARKDLQSLRSWDDPPHKKIKRRIARVLEKYPPIKRFRS